MQGVERRWDADGNAKNIALGFVPDFAILIEAVDETNPSIYIYSKQIDDAESMTAVKINGADGVVTRCTTAATGMEPYNTKTDRVKVPHPSGTGWSVTSVADWAAATSYASGARTTTAVGTVVRPPTHNGRVFELTTATAAGTSAPSSWDVAPGASVTDGGSNVWICREERICAEGAQGVTVGADIQTDAQHCVLVAFKLDNSVNAGDAANVATGGIV